MLKMEIGACKNAKKIKFYIFWFYPTFDMSYLNVVPHQKCQKKKKKKKKKKKYIYVAICFRLRQNIVCLTGLIVKLGLQ